MDSSILLKIMIYRYLETGKDLNKIALAYFALQIFQNAHSSIL